MTGLRCALGATMALACVPAAAQDATPRAPAEVALGVFAHGLSNGEPLFNRRRPPPGFFFEGEEERGTTGVQLSYRSAPLPIALALKPRLVAAVQVNTAGRTSFASVGAQWRQGVFRDRLYGQIGVGLTVHDGYLRTPDPFEPGLSPDEAARRYPVYRNRTAFGSRVLFNPNLSVGVRVTRRWAVEAAWEHYSHAQLFSRQNSGADTAGVRLVMALGR